MKRNRTLCSTGIVCTFVLLALALAGIGHLATIEADTTQVRQLFETLIGRPLKSHTTGKTAVVEAENDLLCDPLKGAKDGDRDGHGPAKTLYIWAGDQARRAPDFLAVINFDEDSNDYGKVVRTVPIPPPGNVGNEPHHCHLSADKNTLACGGLLSLLRGQKGIFFFDVSEPREPRFLFAASAPLSSITDDFFPLPTGGFLITQMGSATGGAPGRVAEFDKNLRLVREWPDTPPVDGFNPHGISARPELNLLVTSDFIDPASTLNVFPGDPILRGSVRVWDLEKRSILRTVRIPDAIGTMDVRMIP